MKYIQSFLTGVLMGTIVTYTLTFLPVFLLNFFPNIKTHDISLTKKLSSPQVKRVSQVRVLPTSGHLEQKKISGSSPLKDISVKHPVR